MEDQNQGQQENQEEQDYNGEMNEVTICVTKEGQDKTMCINTYVTDAFEITSVTFSPSYAEAKKTRFDIFTSNSYAGPEVDSLSDELH